MNRDSFTGNCNIVPFGEVLFQDKDPKGGKKEIMAICRFEQNLRLINWVRSWIRSLIAVIEKDGFVFSWITAFIVVNQV